MKLKLVRRTPKIAFILAFGIILGLNFYMVFHLDALIENNRLVSRTLLIQSRLEELFALINDAETAPRGFVIMGNEKFLEPYYEAVSSKDGIARHLKDLHQLIIDPQQQEILAALEPLVGEKLAFMKKVVELRRSAGFEGAKEWIATDVGRLIMRDIRILVVKMKKREELLQQQRSAVADSSLQRMIVFMTTGFASGIALIIFSLVGINREVKKRQSAEEKLQLLNRELEERVEERTAELSSTSLKLLAELEFRKQTDEVLRQSELRFKTMFDGHSAIMLMIETDTGFILDANQAALQFYGWTIDEFRRKRIQEINALTPEEIEAAIEQTRSGEKTCFLFRHRRSDGSVRDVEVYSSTIETNGKFILYSIIHDVTERRHYETATALHIALLEMEANHSIKELLQLTLDEAERLTDSSISFFHFVAEDQITLTLEAWSTNTIKHMCNAEGEGQHYALDKAGVWADAAREKKAIIHNDYGALKERKGMPEGHAEVTREVVVPVLRNERVVAILGVGNKRSNYDESDVKWVGLLADTVWDIVAKKNAEEKQKILQAQKYIIENMAMHDSLTALPNRRLLSDRIVQAVAQCRRSSTMAALILFDLDKFKPVNDTFGHGMGDLLLQQVATRTLGALRRSGDTLARLGGDEFVVLLPEIAALSNAVTVAENILHTLSEPFEIQGHRLNISCSIGIAIFPLHGSDELTLMKHADEAMYQSKSRGRNCFTFFGSEAS